MNKAFRRILLVFFPVILVISVTSMSKALKSKEKPEKSIPEEEAKSIESKPQFILTSAHKP